MRGFSFNEIIRYRCSPEKLSSFTSKRDNLLDKDMDALFAQDPIDIVYTWVNGSDPIWKRKKDLFRKNSIKKNNINSSYSIVNNSFGDQINNNLIVNITNYLQANESIVQLDFNASVTIPYDYNNFTNPNPNPMVSNETNYFNITKPISNPTVSTSWCTLWNVPRHMELLRSFQINKIRWKNWSS